ncbi:permease of the drug/metabolite transporter (DMT) superfamily [Sporolactobacillus inulinus]|uniref:Permease of the drug/metabolite transporter (DMT) superfamily n=2 Tax=Sporolactobacillus inulinus TaxID=2078 RepID=A0A4Y1ZD79_9BACL|nr:permease of the drug/metabolite transporter (DMT) superfamily [Sporolactobacillus inulinus]
MLGCAEPLSAALVSVVWLHVPFTLFDWLGALCIIGTVVSLAFAQKNVKNKKKIMSLADYCLGNNDESCRTYSYKRLFFVFVLFKKGHIIDSRDRKTFERLNVIRSCSFIFKDACGNISGSIKEY